MDRWLKLDPVFEKHFTTNADILVLRDDVIEGGLKLRFLPFVLGDAQEAVFGGPFCGGAPHAMSVWGREMKRKVTLFYAERATLHPRQEAAIRNGASLHFVRPGYMTVVQKRARDYAQQNGALFLPLGFDVPEAINPLTSFLTRLKHTLSHTIDEIWCTCGSGMLTRTIAQVFDDIPVHAVTVGLASRHGAQPFNKNVTLHDPHIKFEQRVKGYAPFPSCHHYDMKAWLMCQRLAKGKVLFINVAGDT